MTKAVVAFSLATILALAGAGPSSAQAPETRFAERAFVTAIDVVIEVRDAEGKTPAGLTASDFRLLENGIERPIIGVEYLAGPASPPPAPDKPVPAAQPRPEWQIVIWVDGLTTSRGTLRKSAAELALRAGELARLGAVTVVYSDLSPEVILDASRDPAKIEQAVSTLSERAPGDRIARIRRDFVAALEDAAKTRVDAVPPMREFVREEERLVRAGHKNLSRWLGSVPRRVPRALIYVGDGFDLDPAEFYVSILRGSGSENFDAQQARLDATTAAKEANYELARELAVGGWTVLAIGGAPATFTDDVSRSGAGRLSRVQDADEMSNSPLLFLRPSEPLAQLAEETGGERIADPSKLRDALTDIGSRVRITYQVDREPDVAPRRVEIVPRREGLTVRAPEWASSTTTAALAEARAIELLGDGAPRGDLPVIASLRPAASATELPKLEARIDFAPLKDAAAQIGATKLRVTIAVAIPGAPSETFHAIVEVADLGAIPGLLWTAPVRLPENVGAIAIVAEELTSGSWGGARVGARTAAVAQAAPPPPDEPTPVEGTRPILRRPEALALARHEKKSVISLEWGARCGPACRAIERELRTDPELAKRFDSFVVAGPAPGDSDSRLAIYDSTGRLFLAWPAIAGAPVTVRPLSKGDLMAILQSAEAAAPHLARAAEFAGRGARADELLEIALAYQRAGRAAEAETAYAEAARTAKDRGDTSKEQTARVLGALMSAKLGKHPGALQTLKSVAAAPASPLNEAEAQLAIAQVLRAANQEKEAAAALQRALELAPRDSEAYRAALSLSGASVLANTPAFPPVEVVIGGRRPFSGPTRAQVVVRDPAISSVAFRLDDAAEIVDPTPPFEAILDLGPMPRRHEIRATARDEGGRSTGEDVLVVNERHDEFWVRLRSPEDSGVIRAEVNLPAGSRLDAIEFSVDGRRVASLHSDRAAIPRPASGAGAVVRALARLEDGRAAEDAMLVGATGFAEAIEVRDVEIFASVHDSKGDPLIGLDPSQFKVTEGGKRVDLAGVELLGRAPVAVGLAIDSSSSMREIMPDVHRSARAFLDRAVRDGSSAFVIDFDTAPRLAAARTTDLEPLHAAVSHIEANGSTALYDAIIFGLLQLQGVPGKRALIVLTDGRDETSRYDIEDAIAVARESGVAIYLIARAYRPGVPLPDRSGPPPSQSTVRGVQRDPRALPTMNVGTPQTGIDPRIDRLASQTGGRAWYLWESANMDRVYAEIDHELRNQYRISWRTAPGAGASDWRTVKVSVDAPGAVVRTVAGFIAR